jgi:TolB-like protein/DNA-binding winged helix-turn-helix (wHTH) protein/tetratricopeptide (TPR) repeat protein
MLREPPSELAAERSLALGGFVLDVARGELLDAQGRPAGLRAQALKLLLVLGDHAGQVVSKEELQRRVWGDVIVTEDSIVQGIGDIRRMLGDEGHTLLRTVPRRGYLLDAQPARPSATVGGALPPSTGSGPDDGVATAPGVGPVGVATARRWRSWPAVLAVLAVLALMFAAGAVGLLLREAPIPQRSLAILPFESDDPASADAWFVDAITADVHATIARWKSGLKVIGHGTMRRYKGQFADPREVGRELGVAHVLTGRVRRDGERVRIAVEMVETAGGRVVWAQPFEVQRTELPGSIGDIAGGIGKALTIEIGDIVTERGQRLDATQAEADDFAMRGWSVHLKGISAGNFAQARQYFEQAVARDPQSIRGLAGLSMTHSMDVSFTWSNEAAESMRRSKEALDRAEAIDPTAHLTLLARASYLLSAGDWLGQFAVSEDLIRNFPNDPTSYHHRCSSLLRLGRFDESIPACERAIRISPNESRTPIWNGLIGMSEFMLGNYKSAAERARVPATANPNLAFYPLFVAVALAHDGQTDAARRAFDEFSQRHPTWDSRRVVRGWLIVDDPAVSGADPKFVAGLQRIIATARELGLP